MIAPKHVSHVQPTGNDFSDRTGPDIIDRVPMTADMVMPPLPLQLPMRRRTEPWPVVEMPEREGVEAPAWDIVTAVPQARGTAERVEQFVDGEWVEVGRVPWGPDMSHRVPVMQAPPRGDDAPTWRFVLGIVVLSLALVGGLVAAVAQPEPPAPVSCVMTLDGQTTCGTPTEV